MAQQAFGTLVDVYDNGYEFIAHSTRPANAAAMRRIVAEEVDKWAAVMRTGGINAEGDAKTMFAFGAEFVEVRIHARTREIRVPRAVIAAEDNLFCSQFGFDMGAMEKAWTQYLRGSDLRGILCAFADRSADDKALVLDEISRRDDIVPLVNHFAAAFAGGKPVRFLAGALGRALRQELLWAGSRLRRGGRSLGGTLSWDTPRTFAPFTRESPFFGLPVPFMILWAPDWNWIVAANALLGINQGLAWSMTVVMKIDLVGPKRRGFALGLNESAGYGGVALADTVLVDDNAKIDARGPTQVQPAARSGGMRASEITRSTGRSSSMASACSKRRGQSVTVWLRRLRWMANAVPQAPAPSTLMFMPDAPRRALRVP